MKIIETEKRTQDVLGLGIEKYAVRQLTVNEQNPQAKGFYEHLGFRVYR